MIVCASRFRRSTKSLLILLLAIAAPACHAAAVSVIDDMGRQVSLDQPPGRIVSLAPHLTEMLFSLEVGDRIVATVRHSDYPEAAAQIPRLGDAFSLSVEAVIDLSPDLILAWTTGGNQKSLQRLSELGFSIYLNEAATLEDIASNIQRIGELVGRAERGRLLGERFRRELTELEQSGSDRPGKSVFFQIADTQLYTVNDRHLIGQGLAVCGARNIFGDINLSVPLVSLESIVQADPDIILVASPHEDFVSRWMDDWQRLGWQDRIRYINASLITRPSLRMLNGIKSLCNSL